MHARNRKWTQVGKIEAYLQEIKTKLENIEEQKENEIDVDELNTQISNTLCEIQRKHCIKAKAAEEKLSQNTKILITR